jgi:AcrR family transcriptional regulator
VFRQVNSRGSVVKVSARLSAEERREAIIKAVRQVFAEKGFHGTTTRELAEAAGVSEALLFKHFPTKEALFGAMHAPCADEKISAEIRRLMALEPSTSTLVLLAHFLLSKMILVRTNNESAAEDCVMNRLMLRSLMEDGEFARVILQRKASCWIGKAEECIKAATEAGDIAAGPVSPNLSAWFVHHLAVMIMIHLRPPTPAVDYGVTRDRMVEQAVWFALRGLGLSDQTIRRYYNPKAFALLSS